MRVLAGLFLTAFVMMSLPAQAQTAAQVGQMNLRIQQLEEENRRLTGEIERLNHQLSIMQSQGGASSSASIGNAAPPPPPVMTAPPAGTAVIGTPPAAVAQPGGSTVLGAPPQNLGQVPGQPLDLSAVTQAGQAIIDHGNQVGGNIVSAPTDSPKDVYDLSYGYILRGDYGAAQVSFTDFLNRYPQDQLAGNAQYWLGESHFAQGDYKLAADSFLKSYSKYPGNAKGPDSLLKLGMSLNQLGQKDAACSTYQELQTKFPRASRNVLDMMRAEMARTGC